MPGLKLIHVSTRGHKDDVGPGRGLLARISAATISIVWNGHIFIFPWCVSQNFWSLIAEWYKMKIPIDVSPK